MTAERSPAEVHIPAGLAWWRGEPGGAEWLAALPALVSECAARWGLSLGAAFEPASVAFVAPAALPGGGRAVLKLNYPDDESEHEAEALAHWGGAGAARLIAHDPARRALLLERVEPGGRLWEVGEREAYPIAAKVLGRLFRPAPGRHPFRRLADEARRWADEIPDDWERLGRPFERALADEASALARGLAASEGEGVVLHQDLHGGNILSAGGGDWLAIDPKPLVGEREFDAASLLRDRRGELRRAADPAGLLRRRLDVLASELGLDRERMRGWGVVHALAWGTDGGAWLMDHVDCARWLAAIR